MDYPVLDARLAGCERQIRGLRRALVIATSLAAGFAGSILTGFSGAGRISAAAAVDADSLRVHELVVVDSAGVVRARIGGNLPAVYLGRTMPRRDPAAGVLLFDQTGGERGGYVTFDRSGVVALTLDNRGQQVAIFGADSTTGSGATARLWTGRDWAEMKVDQAGPHFTAGRKGAVAFQQPPLTEADGQAVCTELKGEVARIKPAPPTSAVLEACKSHAPDGVCRKCLGVP